MKDQDFQRILDALDGYWGVILKGNALKAWRHALGAFTADAALEALHRYAIAGHPFPPKPGQLASLIDTPRETEADRCRRQMREYRAQMGTNRNCTRRDFDWYWTTYWSLHLPESAYPFSPLPTDRKKAA